MCFLLSGPKIGWRTCVPPLPSPSSPSQTYASGSANPILYATKTIRTWATRCCFEFASIYIHPASFVHASTEFMYTVSLYPLWQLFLYKPGFNGAFMVLDMLLVEDPWRVLSIRWMLKKKKKKNLNLIDALVSSLYKEVFVKVIEIRYVGMIDYNMFNSY